jgi:hypothetical protein
MLPPTPFEKEQPTRFDVVDVDDEEDENLNDEN